jgi:peptide/nickel transport system ATP-binding protein
VNETSRAERDAPPLDAAASAEQVAPSADAPLLSVGGLRVQIAGSRTDVVDEVSFALDRGEVLGLVGESGSGKTTVALALLGHTRRGLAIGGGRVVFDGLDLLRLGSAELRALRGARIAYVAQDPASALQSTLKVGTQLREVFRAHGTGRLGGATAEERISELLIEVGLDRVQHALDVFPHQLSGGQQQRVMLAMAFACRPDLIVLDEPTTGLDVTTQRHVLDTVREMCRSYRVAAVYVSHDLAVVGELADRVGVMYAGRLIELGATARVFTAPGHPYTRSLLRAIPSSTRAHVLMGLAGQPPRPGRRPTGCFFAPRCSFAVDLCTKTAPTPVALDGDRHWARCVRAHEIVGLPPLADLPERTRAGLDLSQVPLLEVNGLAASYGERQVLSDISFAVQPRRCLSIVGESGAGKTTLARCIVGLHSGWSGRIAFNGVSLTAARRRRRTRDVTSRMQYIFQNPYTSLNPRKTVGQLVEQPLRELTSLSRKERTRKAAAALESAALSHEYAGRYPDQLSGGERQRVAIARALVVEPELLVCDEVTSALDVSVQAAIVELLHELKRTRGIALVLITHNLALVRSLADDVLILRDGQIVEHGPSVLDQPQSEYAVTLLDNVPSLALPGQGGPDIRS